MKVMKDDLLVFGKVLSIHLRDMGSWVKDVSVSSSMKAEEGDLCPVPSGEKNCSLNDGDYVVLRIMKAEWVEIFKSYLTCAV